MYLLFRARENGVFIQYICSLCPRMTSHFDQIQRTGSSVVDRGIGQAFDHIDLEGLLGLIPNYALDCILSKKFSSRQPNNEQIILDMAIEISRVMPDNFIIMNHDDNVIVSYFRTPHIRLCFVVKNVDRRDISFQRRRGFAIEIGFRIYLQWRLLDSEKDCKHIQLYIPGHIMHAQE